MKRCGKCETDKDNNSFFKDSKRKNGIGAWCKNCLYDYTQDRKRTKIGIIRSMFNSQKNRSIRKFNKAQEYSLAELTTWILQNDKFNKIFNCWAESDWNKMLVPSIDRIDDSKGYSIDNIQLMTWGENKQKGHNDMRSGKLTHGHKPQKVIFQFNKSGEFIKEYHSLAEACRVTNNYESSVSNCCLGKRKSAGGFIWEYKEDGVDV